MLTTDCINAASVLSEWVDDARTGTLDLVADLTDEQLKVLPLETVNPFIWEIGHVAWFQEKWVLRHVGGAPPIRDDADQLFDSIAIMHDGRWELALPTRQGVVAYASEVKNRVRELLDRGPIGDELGYFVKLSVFHEDMHTEAFTYMRQTLGYAAPPCLQASRRSELSGPSARASGGNIDIPGGTFLLGASRDEPFVFDNEKWAHPRQVRPFSFSAETVTQAQFASFVDSGGYRYREFWDEDGWAWREHTGAEHPVYWSRDGGGNWLRRDFDKLVPLESQHPMVHVNWYEADAWCRWARRRLPTEAEWEMAAACTPAGISESTKKRRRYPWGEEPPTTDRANLDWKSMGTLDVTELPNGDSGYGCRQMVGNVWEWTSSDFVPYPEFTPDPYREYSQPWFGSHKVLRGGCWATRSRLLRATFRNFFQPARHDVFAGFRTCNI